MCFNLNQMLHSNVNQHEINVSVQCAAPYSQPEYPGPSMINRLIGPFWEYLNFWISGSNWWNCCRWESIYQINRMGDSLKRRKNSRDQIRLLPCYISSHVFILNIYRKFLETSWQSAGNQLTDCLFWFTLLSNWVLGCFLTWIDLSNTF